MNSIITKIVDAIGKPIWGSCLLWFYWMRYILDHRSAWETSVPMSVSLLSSPCFVLAANSKWKIFLYIVILKHVFKQAYSFSEQVIICIFQWMKKGDGILSGQALKPCFVSKQLSWIKVDQGLLQRQLLSSILLLSLIIYLFICGRHIWPISIL